MNDDCLLRTMQVLDQERAANAMLRNQLNVLRAKHSDTEIELKSYREALRWACAECGADPGQFLAPPWGRRVP